MNKKKDILLDHAFEKSSSYKERFLPFEEARKLVRSYQLKTRHEWTTFCREGCRPANLPALPNRDYDEFTTWTDFLIEPESNKNHD